MSEKTNLDEMFDAAQSEHLENALEVLSTQNFHQLKPKLFKVAYDAIIDAAQNGYYDSFLELREISYSEVCDWCHWPDFQDGGYFEQIIDAAADAACLMVFDCKRR